MTLLVEFYSFPLTLRDTHPDAAPKPVRQRLADGVGGFAPPR
jgi:hypothetical protein